MVKAYANTLAERAHDADFEVVSDGAEVLHLLLQGDVVVPLFCDGGVLALVDFRLLEWLRHLEGACGCEGSGVVGCFE